MGGVPRSKYLESVLQRVKEMLCKLRNCPVVSTMGGVSRSKYLESVLQRYKEVIGLLAKAFCQDFSGIP